MAKKTKTISLADRKPISDNVRKLYENGLENGDSAAGKLDEEAVGQTALKWFPEKAEEINRSIDDVGGFLYGYLEPETSVPGQETFQRMSMNMLKPIWASGIIVLSL